MAARDYDHLFKLLIIGDSGKCFKMRLCWIDILSREDT